MPGDKGPRLRLSCCQDPAELVSGLPSPLSAQRRILLSEAGGWWWVYLYVALFGTVFGAMTNPFDDIGAEAAGMQAAWVDRSGGLFDTLGLRPEIVVGTLTELADALEARRGEIRATSVRESMA